MISATPARSPACGSTRNVSRHWSSSSQPCHCPARIREFIYRQYAGRHCFLQRRWRLVLRPRVRLRGRAFGQGVLKPLNGVGPSREIYDANNDTTGNCGSLATAYEDTRYRATIYAYWGETGTTTTKVVDFWS